MRQQRIQIFHDFTFDATLESTEQKPQGGVQLKFVGSNDERAFDAGAGKAHLVAGFALFVGAVHGKIPLGLHGPFKGDFARLRQSQFVYAQNMQVSQNFSPSVNAGICRVF